jgi:hypothetical protein
LAGCLTGLEGFLGGVLGAWAYFLIGHGG